MSFYVTDTTIWNNGKLMRSVLVFISISGLLFGTALTLKYVWTGKSKIRSYFIKSSVTGFTLFYSLWTLEIVFYLFITPSDNFNFTLASKRWKAKYWTPINSLGYRDIEHHESQFVGKKIVFVVGDSFAAGFGIKNYNDRFSNVLQKKLGINWLVTNIAIGGWGTAKEYKAIVSYPYKPNIIILSYYINDIGDAVEHRGFSPPFLTGEPPKIIASFINSSYLFNYVYWRLYRAMNVNIGQVYWEYLERCYSDKRIWQTHKRELLDIVNYAKNHNMKLIVVLFPLLTEIERSKVIISKVADLMKHSKVEVIDLSIKLGGKDPHELIVNSFDLHPSKRVHKEVAELLFDCMRKIDNTIE